MGKQHGLKTLIADAVAEGRPFNEPAHQLLLDVLAPAPDDDGEAVPVPAEGAKPGRPPGARNRRTEEMIRYIGGRYGLPLERLAQVYSLTPPALAKLWGIEKEKAADIWLTACRAALEYLHQKLPASIELKGELRAVILTLGDFAPGEQKHQQLEGFAERVATLLDVKMLDAPRNSEDEQ